MCTNSAKRYERRVQTAKEALTTSPYSPSRSCENGDTCQAYRLELARKAVDTSMQPGEMICSHHQPR